MDGETLRWAAGIVALAIIGAGGWFLNTVWNLAHGARVYASTQAEAAKADAREGDRRIYERITAAVNEIEDRIEAARQENKDDRHDLINKIDARLAESDAARERFRELVFKETQSISAAIGELRGLIARSGRRQ